MTNKEIHIISGGTINYIRPHFALAAPAFGKTGYEIQNELIVNHGYDFDDIYLHQTKLASHIGKLKTNKDVEDLLDKLIANPNTGIIFLPVALCDYEVTNIKDAFGEDERIGKEYPRLKTKEGSKLLTIKPAKKLLSKIRKERKDIFLVAFKTTTNATDDEMFDAGMNLLKTNSCNLVLVNDISRKINMILTPEMARYCITEDRQLCLKTLVSMTLERSKGTFHRTDVVKGDLIPWNSLKIPESLRTVVNYCIDNGAYKPFNGVTVGHFGVFKNERKITNSLKKEIEEKSLSKFDAMISMSAAVSHGSIPLELPGSKRDIIYSSRRKKNYNRLNDRDLVKVSFENDEPTAYGDKPSAGVRSQYELFKHNPNYNCVVHFHCPLKKGSKIKKMPQKNFECGSMECGQNTLNGMEQYHQKGIAAVMLDKHGPNILFRKEIDPQIVIDFIEKNFDLNRSTSD